jgi:lipopolysaccharide export system protein LptA
LKNRKLLFICSLFISFCINAKPYKDSIEVDAVSISISADDNKIIFLENVSLKTGDLVLESG